MAEAEKKLTTKGFFGSLFGCVYVFISLLQCTQFTSMMGLLFHGQHIIVIIDLMCQGERATFLN